MSEHKGGTDSIHKIDLPSAIQQVRWNAKSACSGEPAPLQVLTLFVGDGSDVKIKVRTKGGKQIGSLSGKVGQNQYLGVFQVSDQAKEFIYFEVELPKHGLKAVSGPLPVAPPRALTNARWDRQDTRREEQVKLLADTNGLADGTRAKISIFEHDEDGAHELVTQLSTLVEKDRIETTWEYDFHGNTEEIPSKPESEKGYKPPAYFFRVQVGEAKADSGLLTFKDWVDFEFKDRDGIPQEKIEIRLKLPDGTEVTKTTDGAGKIHLEDVPAGKVEIVSARDLKKESGS